MADEEEYLQLSDLKISLDQEELQEDDGFSLCLWLYLAGSARPSSIIIYQMPSREEEEVPFLALNELNKLSLFPLVSLHVEAPLLASRIAWKDIRHISADIDCPREKWVHIGCEVAANRMRLHVNGTLVRENPLSLSLKGHIYHDYLKKISMVGNDGSDGKLQGYVYDLQVLPISESTKDHFIKNPPVKLTFDGSCISDGIEEGGDGVWSVVGGKASCRRNFSLDIVLLDALGRTVHKEMEIIASLIYADTGAFVEKTRDNMDAPLLTSCDGIEFPAEDKPVTLLRGRANFKLKISQLSSKSDNRLFRVCFRPTASQKYPFLEAYSCPIRCISRNRTVRPTGPGKRMLSTSTLPDENCSPGGIEGLQSVHDSNGGVRVSNRSEQNQQRCSPSLKRFKVGHDKSPRTVDVNGVSKQDDRVMKKVVETKSNNLEGTDSGPSDSESIDARTSESRGTEQSASLISDLTVFKYCLEGTCERAMLLKDIIKSFSRKDTTDLADQVCLYSGCSHHRYQIRMAERLIQEGTDAWNSISGNRHRALWTSAASEINKRFMKISRSTTRSLSREDLEVLREIAGCGEDLCQEDFEKIWCWLYPVAFSLLRNQLWECTTPRWIEGLITKEEAENSLKGKPGSFVLRFPTSRSWPHPDAGSLIVTYIGADSTVHHRLLCLELSSEDAGKNSKHLQAMLLEEPELSQLARVTRHGLPFNGAEGY